MLTLEYRVYDNGFTDGLAIGNVLKYKGIESIIIKIGNVSIIPYSRKGGSFCIVGSILVQAYANDGEVEEYTDPFQKMVTVSEEDGMTIKYPLNKAIKPLKVGQFIVMHDRMKAVQITGIKSVKYCFPDVEINYDIQMINPLPDKQMAEYHRQNISKLLVAKKNVLEFDFKKYK